MIRRFALLLISLSAPAASAQEWEWARSAGVSQSGTGHAVALDADGNAYVAGRFQGTAAFGDVTLTNGGMFVAKYSPDGGVLWARSSGGSGSPAGYAIALDHGNAYVSCLFAGTASFGGITLTKPGESQFGIALSARFVAKHGPDGALGADC